MSSERIYEQKNDTMWCYDTKHERDQKLTSMQNSARKLPKNVFSGEYKNIEGKYVFYISKRI